MSLILDALHRADQERSAGQAVPTIQTVPQVEPPQHSFIAWERLAVLVPLLFVALYVVWEWAGPATTADGGPALGRADSVMLPLAGSAMQPYVVANSVVSLEQEPKREVLAGHREGLGAVVHPGKEMNRNRVAPATGSAIEVVRAVSVDDSPVSSSSAGSARAAASADEISRLYAVTVKQPVLPERREPLASQALDQQIARASRATNSGELPYITDLPLQLRRDIPTLNYSEHLPSDKKGAARVRVNGRLFGEGHLVASELTLLTIDELGVIMAFRGVTFRLPALNRWVNF